MARTVRAALLQAEWTGDKESMIQKHEKYAHQAAEHAQTFTVSNVAIASLTNHTNVFVETQRANQAN